MGIYCISRVILNVSDRTNTAADPPPPRSLRFANENVLLNSFPIAYNVIKSKSVCTTFVRPAYDDVVVRMKPVNVLVIRCELRWFFFFCFL